jgi:Mrp family chromosome partitioning ATPase
MSNASEQMGFTLKNGVSKKPMSLQRKASRPAPAYEINVKALSDFEQALQSSEFKRLLNNIIAAQFEHQFRSLAIISSFAGEGRSLAVGALALGYARYMKQSVLIVDAGKTTRLTPYYAFDGRTFERAGDGTGADRGRGLVHVSSPATLAACESEYDLNTYIHEMKQHYNLVVVDTAALFEESGRLHDPILIASYIDASILLQSKRSLERLTMRKLKELFQRHDVHLLGSFFNQWS